MTASRTLGLITAACLLASPALAQEVGPRLPDVQIVDCRTHDAAQETADMALAMSALDLIQAHDR